MLDTGSADPEKETARVRVAELASRTSEARWRAVIDLTERTKLEERLREQTALARLGEMAAVIAHEVKNPLTAVRGAIQVIGLRRHDGTGAAAGARSHRMTRPRSDTFQRILCPVDFSRPSGYALRHAAAVARRSNGRVTALYVNNPLLIAAAAAAAYDERELVRTSRVELKRFIARAVGATDAARIETAVATGEAAREIRKAARRLSADLVVVGTHGLSGPGKWFFGSTTERVLRHATVPILAVPPRRRNGRALAAWPGARVIAAIDLGADALADARAAAAVARGLGARLFERQRIVTSDAADFGQQTPRVRRDEKACLLGNPGRGLADNFGIELAFRRDD